MKKFIAIVVLLSNSIVHGAVVVKPLTLRTLTGGQVAFSAWLLPTGEIVTIKIPQSEYDEFATGGKGMINSPGKPDPDAQFLIAGGGIEALDTVDGWPSVGDVWEVTDPETGTVSLVVATSDGYDFTYSFASADDPKTGTTSKLTGIQVVSSGNRLPLAETKDYTGASPAAITLTASAKTGTGSKVDITAGVLSVDDTYIQKVKTDIDTVIPNHKSVTFDAAASAITGGLSSVTLSHTVASQSDLYLAATTAVRTSQPTTAITFNGDALTARLSASNRALVEIWDIAPPDTGTHDIVYSISIAGSGVVGAWSAYGVDQATPRTDAQIATGTSATPAITVASAVGELVLAHIGHDGNASTITTDATFTQDWNSLGDSTGNDRGGAGAHKAGATTSVTRTDVLAGSDLRWAAAGVSLKAAGAAPAAVICISPFCGVLQ